MSSYPLRATRFLALALILPAVVEAQGQGTPGVGSGCRSGHGPSGSDLHGADRRWESFRRGLGGTPAALGGSPSAYRATASQRRSRRRSVSATTTSRCMWGSAPTTTGQI